MNRYIITDEGIELAAKMIAERFEDDPELKTHVKECIEHCLTAQVVVAPSEFRWHGPKNIYFSDLPDPLSKDYEAPKSFSLPATPTRAGMEYDASKITFEELVVPSEPPPSAREPADSSLPNLPLGLSTFGVVSVGTLPHLPA